MTDRHAAMVGRPAPPIRGIDHNGDSWELAHHLGRTVVLIFHRHLA